MKDETYNGWPNYETWNVMLWMDNEESVYTLYRETARRYADKRRRFTGATARRLCETAFGDATGDGVHFSNGRIRWGKVAEAMRDLS